MRYCGSKTRFMKYLLPILTNGMDKNDRFVDLFGGGMNVICGIPTSNKIAVDNNKYIIALWKELQENGMENIPFSITEEDYNDVKDCYLNGTGTYDDYITGYVGVCCSFGSSWFNGYARYNPNKKEDHIAEARRGLEKQINTFKFLKETQFVYKSYEDIGLGENDIVYCDPPYASTKKYEQDFDNIKFWDWVRKMTKKVKKLYISEYDAPFDFKCIWEMEKKDGLGTRKGKNQNIKTEKLFVYNGI